MTISDDIWAGDKLNRRDEASMLERFLKGETEFLKSKGRDEAFVLAMDARYGEGKSWFLKRFQAQLKCNHPVAFVDAWVDDANQEPLVAIMSAFQEALEPHLDKPGIRDKMETLSRVALPLIGRAIIAAAGSYAANKLGEGFGDEVKAAIKGGSAPAAKRNNKDDEGGAAVESMSERLSALVDGYGDRLLSNYRDRQKSREAFKANLRALAESFSSPDTQVSPPIFIIVDELDRCRPTYAIALLEEIKHLFDVPGIVFIIALHGEQLTKSINAVYGAEFNSQSYLRRFFTRHYQLRKLSIDEMVISHFDDAIPHGIKFSAPQIWKHKSFREARPPEIISHVLTRCEATPRETLSVIDALRIFCTIADKRVPIELPLVLVFLMNLVRGDTLENPEVIKGGSDLGFVLEAPKQNTTTVTLSQLFEQYRSHARMNLEQLMDQMGYHGNVYYFGTVAKKELLTLHGNMVQRGTGPHLTWAKYSEMVQSLGDFLDYVDQPED